MKEIKSFNKNGYSYELVRKGQKTAIFKGTNQHGSVCFEVHKIRISPESTYTIAGNTIHSQESEKLPSNEDFGTYAFAYGVLELANKKFEHLENQ